MKKLLLILFIPFALMSCKQDESPKGDPAAVLNEEIILPEGSYQVDPEELETDNSIMLGGGSSTTTPITVGSKSAVQISFSTTKKNIIAAGMRFGDSGPVNMVPIPTAKGNTSGSLTVPFTVSQSTCDKLSSICHDIKCYEFAMTSDGKISKANIRDVALLCGNCDEPSCVDLINPPCPTGGGGGGGTGAGTGKFNFRGTNYSGTSACTSVGDVIATSSGSSAAIYNVSSGSYTLQDYAGSGFDINTDPYILINAGGTIYASKSGTVSKNNGSISFNIVVTDIINETTYTASGSMSCN